ncbi:DUF1559 family PulG-like putative transporter [Bremerella sp. P1]|uniref:DUF1559 family PulG-like putative transporter n=1 Tax=Bremerella sp. P1 TaxID=3026424 RepID=UPI002367EBD7|nr:DUF1559 domain-containing protein [Bremerella sp. P1]WDI44710.1 DUF1559 domain-containing protein [Bremerella sp. P1]
MNEPNPFDSPQAYVTEPEPKKWWQITVAEMIVIVLIVIVLIGLLLPPANMGSNCSRRTLSANNLKNIGLALHNYHDTYGSLPPAVVTDAEGRPLYSWRVLLLPFLEEQALYDQFDLTQPWYSQTNRPLADQIPDLLQSPYLDVEKNPAKTSYLAVIDPENKQTVMLSQEGRSLDEVPCELGNVVVVVEQIDHPVIWTKPEDISPFELIDVSPIGQNDLCYYPALFADVSVKWLPRDDPQQLRACLTCQDTGQADETPAQE